MTKVGNICEEAGLDLAPLGPSVSVWCGGSHLKNSRLLFITFLSIILLFRIYSFYSVIHDIQLSPVSHNLLTSYVSHDLEL